MNFIELDNDTIYQQKEFEKTRVRIEKEIMKASAIPEYCISEKNTSTMVEMFYINYDIIYNIFKKEVSI